MRDESDVLLVGWSMGGSTALRLAIAAPEKLKGLVLVAATARMMKAPGWAGMSERRLAALDPALRVLPGHGPATTIGRELATNPWLHAFGIV